MPPLEGTVYVPHLYCMFINTKKLHSLYRSMYYKLIVSSWNSCIEMLIPNVRAPELEAGVLVQLGHEQEALMNSFSFSVPSPSWERTPLCVTPWKEADLLDLQTA